MFINHAFDNVDLVFVHQAACFAGIFLSLWCMQLFGRDVFEEQSCPSARFLRRFAMVVLGIAFCWSIAYTIDRHWQPWPSDVLATIGIDLYLVSIIIAAANRQRAMG